ncbi:MAG: MarR family transcriptional regulator [Desulfobacterales bacterium]|nr:MarR family transcriptional regulator [Deltaproteobacteria bacterium]NNK93883.1 MarR family transcriptional regulator [Desulfobacterales bacterium]
MTRNQNSNQKTIAAVSDGVLVSLRRIIQAIDLHSRQLVRQHGITTPQLLILKEVEAEGAITVSRLANKISLKQTTVTDILNRLEKKELVRRTKDVNDRRRVLIEETDAGKKLPEKEGWPAGIRGSRLRRCCLKPSIAGCTKQTGFQFE